MRDKKSTKYKGIYGKRITYNGKRRENRVIRVIRGKGNKFQVNDRSRIKCGMTLLNHKRIGKDTIQGEDIYPSIPLRNPSITADSVCGVLSESWR